MIPAPLTPAFARVFGGEPAWVVRSPGRVNLIGEHTDYNQGYVLPMAIDRAIWLALCPRPDGWVRVISLQQEGEVGLSLRTLNGDGLPAWGRYLRGVALALREAGYPLPGWEGVIWSDLPVGAGLSSSAALEMAVMRAFSLAAGWAWDPLRVARLGQRAEWLGVGVACGLMDQLTVAAGRAGHALWIDCRMYETVPVPLPDEMRVLVLDTGTRRDLQAGEYNRRRAACERAAARLGVSALRDVEWETFLQRAGELPEEERRRARHVIRENQRVLQAVAALRAGNLVHFGALLNASHASLRDDFEVSTPALDAIVATAQAHPACYGARLTGAGFGGCAVAVVEEGGIGAFIDAVTQEYQARTGLDAAVYLCRASNGVEVVGE